MTKAFWPDEEGAELLRMYYSRGQEETQKDISRTYSEQSGRSIKSVESKLFYLLATTGVFPSHHPDWDNAPQVQGDALVIGDLHIPYHDAQFIERCLALAKSWKISQCILGGDALDARAFSHFPENFSEDKRKVVSSEFESELLDFAKTLSEKKRNELIDKLAEAEHPTGDIGEEFAESRAVLQSFTKSFDFILWMMGNHEAWVVKQIQKAMPAKDLAMVIIGENPKWQVSPYYWCSLTSNKVEYQIEHPKNSGKGSSKKLSAKFNKNIIMLHNHQLSMQADPSGQFLAIETGCGADVKKIQYANQRHDAADEHITGAVMIRGGKAWLLNKFTDWEYLLKKV